MVSRWDGDGDEDEDEDGDGDGDGDEDEDEDEERDGLGGGCKDCGLGRFVMGWGKMWLEGWGVARTMIRYLTFGVVLWGRGRSAGEMFLLYTGRDAYRWVFGE